MIRKPALLRGRVERLVLDSKVLRTNPLGDPYRRELLVYLPPEYDKQPAKRFPVFVDIVGFMGSGAAHLNWKPFDESVPLRLERLVRTKKMGPVIAVFPDCWTRLGGNQYINSPAVGRYADYLIREVVPEVEARFRTFGDPGRRALFGKSSGGYGSIVHAMRYAKHWGAVACHSGDMYFEYCYGHDMPKVLDVLAKHRRDPARFLRSVYGAKKIGYDEGHTLMFLAMAAFYDPDPKAALGFHLPMDLETGEVDARRWSRWLRHDPVRLVEQKSAQKNLRSLKGIYIDCGNEDQYFLHYGARILRKRLKALKIAHRYEEFPDNHSSVDYRMDTSLPWLYRKVMGRARA